MSFLGVGWVRFFFVVRGFVGFLFLFIGRKGGVMSCLLLEWDGYVCGVGGKGEGLSLSRGRI